MSWIAYTLISAACFAIASIIGKYVSDPDSEPVFISFFANVYAAMFSWIFVLSVGVPFDPPPLVAWSGLLVSGIVSAFATLLYWTALKSVELSRFTLFSRTQILFVFVGSLMLYGETWLPFQMVGIACVVLGTFLISYRRHALHLDRAVWMVIASAFLFGIEVLIDRSVIGYFTPQSYTALLYSVIAVSLAVPAAFSYTKRHTLPSPRTHAFLASASFLYAVSTVAFFNSYSHGGTVSLTSVVFQLEIPIVVLYGIFILRERSQVYQKLFATLLMLVGGYILLTTTT